MEREKIKEKIVKMLQKTVENGATEAEALEAMEKASTWMQHYNIEMSELQIKSTRSKQRNFDYVMFMRRQVADTCFVKLGRLFDAIVWRDYNSCYAAYGFPEDTEVIEYMYRMIAQTIMRELGFFKQSETYRTYRGHKLRLSSSFITGMESRINERLEVMIMDKKRIEREAETTGRALVALKSQQIKEEFDEELGIKFTSRPGSRRRIDAQAFQHGRNAGDKISLGKVIGNAGRAAISAV